MRSSNKMSKNDFIPLFIKIKPMDKKILDELSDNLKLSFTDIIKVAVWNYAHNTNNVLIRDSIKELARARALDFNMDILKELEKVNNRQAFFLDGFRTMLSRYHAKHVPSGNVKKFITIKLVGMYSLFSTTKERKEFMCYIKKHFLHYYPNERKWIQQQINFVRSMKTKEKDRLLLKLQNELPTSRNVLEMQKVDKSS